MEIGEYIFYSYGQLRKLHRFHVVAKSGMMLMNPILCFFYNRRMNKNRSVLIIAFKSKFFEEKSKKLEKLD